MQFNRYRWRDLLTDPPTGEEYAVILWPVLVDCGHSYTLSNPQFARENGLKNGYCSWMELKCHPDHDKVEKYTEEFLKNTWE